jgi:hypothetical protein
MIREPPTIQFAQQNLTINCYCTADATVQYSIPLPTLDLNGPLTLHYTTQAEYEQQRHGGSTMSFASWHDQPVLHSVTVDD